MSSFERYLRFGWVCTSTPASPWAYCFRGLFGALAALEYGSVNFVVAILIWFMVYTMMFVTVDFARPAPGP